MNKGLDELLHELEIAYAESDIKKYCLEEGHEWFYSLVATNLEQNGPLVLGFNWGARQNEKYKPQTFIEKSNFAKTDVGSISRTFPYFRKYFGSDFLSKASQSNYCFFRSKNENQITSHDIKLCEPVFEKLVTLIKPTAIFCFSSQLRDYFLKSEKICDLKTLDIVFKRGSSDIAYTTIKGSLSSGISIFFLPHPNYPMKRDARDKAWEFCCAN